MADLKRLTNIDLPVDKLNDIKPETIKKFLTSKDEEVDREALKEVKPSILAFVEKKESETTLEFFKVGILRISFSSADKSKVLSTFGDSFVIQSFGRLPTFISLEGLMISYGTLNRGSVVEDTWKSFVSFTAFYNSLLNKLSPNSSEDSGIRFALLYYNGMLYKCIFDRFSRTKSLPMDTVEYFSTSGLVLKKFEAPFKVKATQNVSQDTNSVQIVDTGFTV